MASGPGNRIGAFAAALGLALWGSAGLFQGLNRGFSGGLYDPEYRVPGVVPGGAAEQAGFQAGDRVVSVQGIPVERLGMESRWPRELSPRIGETYRFEVERGGRRITLNYTYAAPFPAAASTRLAAGLAGLIFLACGAWAFLAAPTPPGRSLGQFCLVAGAGVAFGLGPGLGSWSGLQSHVGTAASVLACILALRFFVLYPQAKRLAANRVAAVLALLPWVGLLAFLVAELALHPALYYSTGTVTFPLTLLYLILILAALTHTVLKASREERRGCGLNFILYGLPAVWLALGAGFLSGLGLPGWAWGLAIGAIPVSMALAVRRQAGAGRAKAFVAGAF